MDLLVPEQGSMDQRPALLFLTRLLPTLPFSVPATGPLLLDGAGWELWAWVSDSPGQPRAGHSQLLREEVHPEL